MIFSLIKKVSVGTAKTVANVPAWLSYRYMRWNTKEIVSYVRPFYTKPTLEGKRRSTFEEVVNQYQLTDADLAKRMTNLKWQTVLFATLMVLSIIYMLYLFSGLHILAGVISLTITGLLFIKLCTCRFWMFQIRERKLGCSIQEWLKNKK